MYMDATVNLGDIARLVDVGRAAVSNWRRRHEDFPRPVGGTASSPLFSLAEVEDWLRRNGKSFEVSPADRIWQRLRAAEDDLRLGELVVEAGREIKDHATFEFLCQRYFEAHSRRLNVTPVEVAELMVRLVGGGPVTDPACGVGTLLMAAGSGAGQELDPVSARISALRVPGVQVVTGDSLRANGLARANAVVCDPPWHDRTWGYDELIGDARWEYGLPPRGEPELAWVQHCLSLAEPGGRVAILLPLATASRRPGKRIRGNLLRAGALLGVVTLPGATRDLWLLRRPVPGEAPPSKILLLEAENLADVESAEASTRIIDLLDDDVDLSPARHRDADVAAAFSDALRQFGKAAPVPPSLAPSPGTPMTTLGELIKAAPGDEPVTSPTGATYLIDPELLDPAFLAGALRAALAKPASGSSRLDVKRTPVPRLTLAEQRAYGAAFEQLTALDETLRAATAAGEALVRLGFEGLLGGRLGPR
ncbi:N-6 DNA methylase [Amycolatopsis sp. cg5]|uniref:N-6 DNA methylase n=1 Tax=Amycolatopsis sp. cg5 TaxID=3238802 RepID=UPI0035245438